MQWHLTPVERATLLVAKLQQTTELSCNTSFAKLYLPAATGSLCTTVETECPRYELKMCVASYTLSEECS